MIQKELDKFDAFLDSTLSPKLCIDAQPFLCRKINLDGKEYFDWSTVDEKPLDANTLLRQFGLTKGEKNENNN
jgi:hypothetical protein